MFTAVVVLAAAAVLLVYEFRQILTGRDTISQQIWTLNRSHPEVGFLVGLIGGLLGGHLFWR